MIQDINFTQNSKMDVCIYWKEGTGTLLFIVAKLTFSLNNFTTILPVCFTFLWQKNFLMCHIGEND